MTWKPIVAGILNVTVGVITLVGTFFIVMLLVGIGGGILAISRITDLLPMWLSVSIEGVLVITAILLIVLSALPLLSGIYAIQRKNWGWALVGSILAIFSSAIVGVISTVLVLLSKDEFEESNRFI